MAEESSEVSIFCATQHYINHTDFNTISQETKSRLYHDVAHNVGIWKGRGTVFVRNHLCLSANPRWNFFKVDVANSSPITIDN